MGRTGRASEPEAAALIGLGHALRGLGRGDEACAAWLRARAIYDRLGNSGAGEALTLLAAQAGTGDKVGERGYGGNYV